jgi:regulator of chromosome condensation
MHTLALSTTGHVFSFGCNDEKALGRDGEENVAEPVMRLPMGVTDIVAGDSHSIAYNTIENKSFYWGCYRVSNI